MTEAHNVDRYEVESKGIDNTRGQIGQKGGKSVLQMRTQQEKVT